MMETLTPGDLRGLASEVERGATPPYVSTRLRQMADKLEHRPASDGKPHARSTDRSTSHAAAQSTARRQTENQEAVLRVFRALTDATDEELVAHYERLRARLVLPEQSESGLRTRRRELVDRKRLRDSGRTRRTRGGRQATVWELVPAPVESPSSLF
jgi:hypothetical protein